MKSVKNFFIERMHSLDHSEDGGGGAPPKPKPSATSAITTPVSAPILRGGAVSATQSTSTIESDEVNAESAEPAATATTTEAATNDDTVSPFNFTPKTGDAASAAVTKPQKARRKISLPWFRQSSVTSHVTLSRQHTIDSPGSFRFFRQPSVSIKVGASHEATWVVSDYIATPGSNELSVTKGQQVEIVEPPSATEPDFCLVRLNPQSDDAAVQEGLVPVSILKPPPGSQKHAGSNVPRKDNADATLQESGNNRGKADPLTSSTKRRGFSGRKWIPFRSSQSKPPLLKKASEKNMKPSTSKQDDEHYVPPPLSTHSASAGIGGHYGAGASAHHQQPQTDFEPEEEAELPPPMKPIQEPHIITTGGQQTFTKDNKDSASNMSNAGKMDGNPSVDLSEIEQIVKMKTENFRGGNSVGSMDKGTDSNGRRSATSGGVDLGGDGGYEHNSSSSEHNSESTAIETALKQRNYAILELISSEESYVNDLAEVVNCYIPEIRNPSPEISPPDSFKGKSSMVFGNIKDIYEWHRDHFLKALKSCEKSPEDLGAVIKRSQSKLQYHYKVYCQNKPLAEYIVNEYSAYFYQLKEKFNHRLGLPDYLIKPVQRVTKYELLLVQIEAHTERAKLTDELDSLRQAIELMKVVCKDVNNMMQLRYLQNFDGKVITQGKLLKHGILTCCEGIPGAERGSSIVQKPRELQVFLFEQSIIFADVVNKKMSSYAHSTPTYNYRSLIQVNKMQMEELPNNRFRLKSTDPNSADLNMICYAATIDTNREWLDVLRSLLQQRNDFVQALSNPIEHVKKTTTHTNNAK